MGVGARAWGHHRREEARSQENGETTWCVGCGAYRHLQRHGHLLVVDEELERAQLMQLVAPSVEEQHVHERHADRVEEDHRGGVRQQLLVLPAVAVEREVGAQVPEWPDGEIDEFAMAWLQGHSLSVG